MCTVSVITLAGFWLEQFEVLQLSVLQLYLVSPIDGNLLFKLCSMSCLVSLLHWRLSVSRVIWLWHIFRHFSIVTHISCAPKWKIKTQLLLIFGCSGIKNPALNKKQCEWTCSLNTNFIVKNVYLLLWVRQYIVRFFH